ncbi:MAG: cupin domain-containing protein [Deltaproteobacteria bacterium]|nr:cupin domain-containing protein [Deltaproteobacteria bacterium]
MRDKAWVIRRAGEVSGTPVDRARGTTIQVLLGPAEDVPNFVLRRFTLEPGGRIPTHLHDSIEHEQYVVEGELVVSLGGEEQTLRAGDSLFIPAGTPHWYENRKDVPARFLCVVPRTDRYRTEWLDPE